MGDVVVSERTGLSREEMIRLLTIDDLRQGHGNQRQRAAFEEYEWRKCAADPLYFFDNYGWIVLKDSNAGIKRWMLWPRQREMVLWLFAGHSLVAIKARQLGVTTTVINYRLWKITFMEAAKCYYVSDSEDKAKEALERVHATLDRMPDWMRDRAMRGGKTREPRRQDKKDGATEIRFGMSKLHVLTSTPNSVAGVSGDVDLDEFGRHRQQKRVLDNAIPAFRGGGQLTIIGNGNGEDELYFTYYKAKRGDFPGMKAYFFSWKDDPTRDWAWYKETEKMYLRENPDEDVYSFRQQYPSTEDEAFYVTGNSFFDLGTINSLQLIVRGKPEAEVGYIERVDEETVFRRHHGAQGKLRVYEHPIPDGVYVIGGDPSGGRHDHAVGQVGRVVQDLDEIDEIIKHSGYLNPPSPDGKAPFEYEPTSCLVKQVAVYESLAEPVTFAGVLENLAMHYNDAYVVVERNNHGGTVINVLKERYWNLYRQVVDEKFADDFSDNIGYYETERSKTELCDMLRAWTNRGWLVFHDSMTLTQMARFGYDERKRLTAPKGLMDDLVIGAGLMLIGTREMVKNRKHREKLVNFGPMDW